MSDERGTSREWVIFLSLLTLILFVTFLLGSGLKDLERRVGTIETKVK